MKRPPGARMEPELGPDQEVYESANWIICGRR